MKAIVTGGDHPQGISGIRFGEGMFQLLGVQPLLGRTFQADDFKPANDRVLVLGHSHWQRRFGGDPGVIGQVLTLSGEYYTVVGVMPPQFRFALFWATKAEMARPLALTPGLLPGAATRPTKACHTPEPRDIIR